MTRRLRVTVVVGALLLPVAIGGFSIRERAAHDGARVFDQVMSLVSDRFVDTVDASALYEKAARGLVTQLHDPYSELFSPTELKRFSTQSTGRYGGIGMQIENQDGQIVVVHVFSHSPAQSAGVQDGDHIIGIDTASTRGWSSQQVSDVLIGTVGTQVKVRFSRPGVSEPIDYTFTRAEIHVPAVPYALMLNDKIAYIPLQTFNEDAADELQSAVNNLVKQGAKSIVLDLRNNPGGILDQGLQVADLFLKSGQQIASVRMRQGAPQVYTAHDDEHIQNLPLVVMVDGYSASAAEIVTGALQDHDRALVVGTTSFGKGLVQTVFPIDGGWALKLTTGKWYTPSGRSIQKNRKPANPDDLQANASEAPPDSLEKESVKQNRPAYRSDAGRIVYGGGGITPDVIIADDTITTPEQTFFKAIAPKYPAVRGVLYSYALQLKGQVSPKFTVKPEWRDEFYRRLQAAKITVDRAQYDSAAPLINRWIGNQVAELAFGDSTEFRREIPDDKQLQRAMELLRKGGTQKDLFSLAQGASPPVKQ
ncbi:MAG TPA: S41 family peptidase [Gemmatimonadaceae bacterium]|nr:S41 family peptidase [Gemmatimonadaceae bacterium]